jgi:hypothetical protein
LTDGSLAPDWLWLGQSWSVGRQVVQSLGCAAGAELAGFFVGVAGLLAGRVGRGTILDSSEEGPDLCGQDQRVALVGRVPMEPAGEVGAAGDCV